MQAFYPVESLTNANQMTFNLPRFLGPNSYLPNKMMLKVEVKLQTPQNAIVPASKRIAPVNNVLQSLFRSCRIWVGEQQITKCSENYNYKSFIIDYLSFDGFAKYSWLTCSGYYQDSYGRTLEHQTSTHNRGFENRRKLFRNEDDTAYSGNSIVFVGRPHTDFLSTENGLVPGLGLRVQFTFASNEFLLMVPKPDQTKYKLTIENACLMCPVAQLSPTLYRSIETKLNSGAEAKMYFTRTEVTNKSISKGSSMYVESLFAGAALPSRLILAFVPTSNYFGSYATTPYYFARRFNKKLTSDFEEVENLQQQSSSSSGSSTGIFRRAPPVPEPEDFEILQADDTGPFIENVSLTLNGENLDGFEESKPTMKDDMSAYMRMQYFQGFPFSSTGNNATYDEFLHGYYFLHYDLTTASQAGLHYLIPTVRQGHLQLQVHFSDSIPVEVTLLVYAEYPTLMKTNANRQISLSY